ncbi:hypothetical protein HJ526_00775 [Donghicola sp. C2-DW-16]|uniref:DUF922 domain-containing protein n=1 Tax=Donghicola mangrovi TaxID=2729614 RepID=A0ABX2PB97_9RHOB|nr:hypothetical protein [Donghicola mangrovi]NVO25939.1 hypothetical protein [Donghicola mangrovi]
MLDCIKTFKTKAAIALAVISFVATPAFAAKPPSAKQIANLCNQAPLVQVVENLPQPIMSTAKPASLAKKMKAGWRVQGLTELKRSFKANFQWEMLNTASGTCLRIKTIQVTTGSIAPKVWINPSIRRNSCDYKTTLRHELEHVDNHNVYVREFSNDLRRNLATRLKGNTGMLVKANADPRAAKDALMQRTMAVLQQVNSQFDAVADAKDRHMDTDSNYRREYAACR